jgi:toxin CcdB
MSQFHVYRLPDGMAVLDLQTDLIDTGTRVVAPLLPITEALPAIRRLEPIFELGEVPLALHTAEMAAVPAHLLTVSVADLSDQQDAIRSALDMVFSGF